MGERGTYCIAMQDKNRTVPSKPGPMGLAQAGVNRGAVHFGVIEGLKVEKLVSLGMVYQTECNELKDWKLELWRSRSIKWTMIDNGSCMISTRTHDRESLP